MPGDHAPLNLVARIGLAIAMAVFMGLAFEDVYKRGEHTSPGGIRTFPMLALLGTLLYLLDPRSLIPYLAGLAAVAVWLYAHIRGEPQDDPNRPGLVVPTANLLAYTFGPVALTQPQWLEVGAAVAAVLLLEGREALHRLVLKVPSDEVFTLGKFLILVGVVLPLVPSHPVVAWTSITPLDAWLALVAISTLSYASYLLQRYLPLKSGALLPTILGGLYSSTATTVALAREQRALGAGQADFTADIVLATAIMYVRINAVVAVFNLGLARALLPGLGGLFVVAAAVAAWQGLRAGRALHPRKLVVGNPLQLGTAAVFAALFVVLALATAWIRARFGQHGIYALAAVTGVTDIAPFVLGLAQGSVTGMSVRALCAAILIAASSNNVLKAVYALIFGGVHACRRAAVLLVALALAGLLVTALYLAAGS